MIAQSAGDIPRSSVMLTREDFMVSQGTLVDSHYFQQLQTKAL